MAIADGGAVQAPLIPNPPVTIALDGIGMQSESPVAGI